MKEDLAIQLVRELAPLNNAFRQAVKEGLPGNAVLKILWDAGDVICSKNIDHVHKIAWQMYGRSDSKRHSYLTRDYITYCWRVRRYFEQRDDIDRIFPKLETHMVFKEALPLLTNPKYILSPPEREEMYALLNNDGLMVTQIIDCLAEMKKRKLPIRNPRTQRLHELDSIRRLFDAAFSNTHSTNLGLTKAQANYLSGLWLALVGEGRSYPQNKPAGIAVLGAPWKEAIEVAINLLTKKNVEDRNRFRRVVKPEELLRASATLSKLFQNF